MRTLNITIILVFSFLLQEKTVGQEPWSLEKCIEYAIENNIQVKQTKLQAQSSASTLSQSKAGLLPDVNANISDAFYFGRTIDPYTNQFTSNEYQSLNASITATVTLFNGLQQVNTLKQNNYTLLAELENVEEIKNSISVQVATAYMQILFDEGILEVTRSQLEITKSQVARTKILVEAGSLAKGNLLEIQAQLATEQLNKITAENNLKTSYLTLTQLLELDTTEAFEIQIPKLDEPSEGVLIDSVSSLFEKSQNLPRIKKQEYYLQSSEKSLLVAKGGVSPRFYASATYGSGYSSNNKLYTREIGDPYEIGYVGNTGDLVLSPSINNIEQPYNFGDQLNDNKSWRLTLGVQIPIFNNYYVKNRVSQSKIQVENSEYQLELSKNQLFKDIQIARNFAEAALAKYNASKKAVEAQEESFSYMQQKFDLGLVNSLEYNTAKNQLTKSQSEMLQAKFEFIFRINILNFYQGIPFQL